MMLLMNISVDGGRDMLMFFRANVFVGDSLSDVLVDGCLVLSVIVKELTDYSLCLIHC